MPDRSALRWLGATGLGYALALALTPHPPCIDLPQHIALGAVLRRLWDADPATLEAFATNPATHNAGLHLLLALGARLVPVELGARLLVAAYPPLLLAGLALTLRALGLPAWRALLAVPALLGFSFGWGLINFCLGTALAWLGLALVLEQLAAPRAARALWLALLSAALGLTHVMAMALFGLVAAASALEWSLRAGALPPRARPLRAALALAPLSLGGAYDLWVVARHLASDAGSYTTPPLPAAEAGAALLPKLYLFASLCAGLFGSYLDNLLAWAAIALVAWLALAGRGAPARAGGRGARPPTLVAPFALTLAVYLALPAVVFNTHLIYQRLAQWVLLSALLAWPPRERDERLAPRIARGLAAAAGASTALHLALYTRELGGLDEVVGALPPAVRSVGVIEEPRTRAVRMPTLTHAAALAVARGGLDDGFGFARWMGFPVVYRPGRRPPPQPSPSWEHDARQYDPKSALARHFPWVVVRAANEGEADEALLARLFGDEAGRVRVVRRAGRWAALDTTALGGEAAAR
ncbi:MAG TPA: hypothetical protein VFS43_01865 [Polyangiaceae bacterium]|nr:hypothetical protein [Polyangiaceae bacterium]